MSKDDSSPAFPIVCHDLSKYQVVEIGMTRRQWLAGLAMQGLIASWTTDDTAKFADQNDDQRASMFAFHAYKVAGAMLAHERKEATG